MPQLEVSPSNLPISACHHSRRIAGPSCRAHSPVLVCGACGGATGLVGLAGLLDGLTLVFFGFFFSRPRLSRLPMACSFRPSCTRDFFFLQPRVRLISAPCLPSLQSFAISSSIVLRYSRF